jgi:hypothetical protein
MKLVIYNGRGLKGPICDCYVYLDTRTSTLSQFSSTLDELLPLQMHSRYLKSMQSAFANSIFL